MSRIGSTTVLDEPEHSRGGELPSELGAVGGSAEPQDAAGGQRDVEEGPAFDLTYLSLGAGVQSTALYILAAQGRYGVPRADVAVFADTGDEPEHVYRQLAALEEWGLKNGGAPIVRVSAGMALSEAMKVRWVPIPAFTQSDTREGMLRRQCTKEFKVVPIQRYIKEQVLGRPRGYPVKQRVRSMMGFSAEEVFRMKPSREKWITSSYPLVDANLYRSHCVRIVEDAGLGTPRKSACVYCPFHSDRYWAEMKRDDPAAFQKAVDVDEMIRSADSREQLYKAYGKASSSARVGGRSKDGIAADNIYVHRSCKPLKDVEFGDQPALWGEECEGHCGV